jgi:glycosyltransferase involved in cell wall biosynthesis
VVQRPRVGLLHYTCPPVVGGVEAILYEQASRLQARGYEVTIFSGRGGPLPNPDIRLVLIPELDSRNPQVTAVREQLLQGVVPPAFAPLQQTIEQRLGDQFRAVDVLIAHNVLSLHFNLPLTAALWSVAQRQRPRIISWVHDLSWVNPLYRPWMHEGEPWDLLRRSNPHIRSIFISQQRCREWQSLTGEVVEQRQVVPNGIDASALLHLGAASRALADRFKLLETDVVMLAPVRITRRKNLAWAIDAAAAVRDRGQTVQLLITGPPGPHNPRSVDYLDELKELTKKLRLEGSIRFLFEESIPGREAYSLDLVTLADLYMLSDVVVLPSASEGFGLPLAEAAVYRTPIVCTDLPVFQEVAPEGATVVPLQAGSPGFTEGVLRALDSPPAKMRRHVLRTFSWERLISERLEPMLNGGA